MIYAPSAWYWLVGGDTSRLWSSASAGYVPAADPGYVAWASIGGAPTSIGSETELHDVLVAAYPAGVGGLGTVPQRAAALLAGGAPVTLTSAATPTVDGQYTITQQAIADITALQSGILAGVIASNDSTFPYTDASNVDHQFTGAEFTAFGGAVLNYIFALTRCAQGKNAALPPNALSIP